MVFIPPLLAFYELALRGYFPLLPSVFAMAFNLYQRGILTVDIIIWLASSLPANFLGGLGTLGGVAMQTTAVMVGGAASTGNVLVGTATGIVGNTSKTVTQGINHLNPGVAVLAEGTTQAVAGGLSLVTNSQTVVKENISHLITGELAITNGILVPDIAKNAIPSVVNNTSAITGAAIGATNAAVTENATKLANVLDSVSPLHFMPKGSQDSQVCVILFCIPWHS
jgi:X-X-X-Leu-X-X-Gly heptad repeat protein